MKLLPAIALLAMIIFSAQENKAQETTYGGSRYQALADATVSLSGCWSVFGNQAGLAVINRPELAGSFQNRFLVSELSTRIGFFILPVQSSVFAVSVYQFGKIPFRQEKFGITYARQIFPKLNFGVQFNYYNLFLSEENKSAGSFGLELGSQYLLSDRLVIGLHVLNPYQTSLKMLSGNFQYPSQISMGVNYHFSESFSLLTELDHDFNKRIRIKTGIEYMILDKLFLRTGISGKPYQFSAGIGFKIKKLILDLATSYNQYLGNSPSVSFQYQF